MISPWAKRDSVSHVRTDQSSIIRFIEWNWRLGDIAGSAATIAGSITPMFDFDGGGHGHGATRTAPLFLDPTTGAVERR